MQMVIKTVVFKFLDVNNLNVIKARVRRVFPFHLFLEVLEKVT